MSKNRSYKYFVGDFETTVYKGQTATEVWASACVEMYTEDVKIFHSIDEQFEYFTEMNCNIVCYYHNLKFDGAFWLSYLLVDLNMKQAVVKNDKNEVTGFKNIKDMENNSFAYSISNMGQWYRITIKYKNHIIELRDSLKLLPFSVKRIGESFQTKHKKLDMEYTGFRYAGCEITEEEQKYIANDVLVVKEALEIMFQEGHNKLTIGACCLDEFKRGYDKQEYEGMFPNLYEMPIDEELYKCKSAGDYIRQAYRGGWCYLVHGKENKIKHNGTTADVNSLYPSMMSSESGNEYPIGKPIFWSGNFIPNEALKQHRFFFIRVKTRFYIKENKLPFIQLKKTLKYTPTEMLKSSDIYDPKTDKYYDHYIDTNGKLHDTRVVMTMTQIDYRLMCEHYELVDFEILDGCYFRSYTGLFDDYIERYKKIKLESKGARRELAKLFLNNLYGKLASSMNSSFKVAFIKDDKSLGFYTVEANDKKPGYIPVGVAITSYARNFTIRAAQKNYHGVNERGFIYADTDSIHCDLLPDEIVGITEHPRNFCCWKLESCWDTAIFTRQKTYIEHITHEDRQPVEKPFYEVKCAGMPEKCKQLFVHSMMQDIDFNKKIEEQDKKTREYIEKLTEDEKEFIKNKRTINDFKIGLKVPGKLLPKRIQGGVLLVDTTYEMR